MRILYVALIGGCCFLAACAGNRSSTVSSADDYVEIDNPAMTMTSNAPATIWVPRSYVEHGVPRGGELVRSGAEQVAGKFRQPEPHADTAEAPVLNSPVAMGKAPIVRNRIALLEIGQNGLIQPFYEMMRNASIGVITAPSQTAFISQFSTITNQKEKGAFARRLQQDLSVNVTAYVSAPDGVAAGKVIVAEVFDSMGGGLLRRFDVVVPLNAGPGKNAANGATDAALATLTEQVHELISLLPWYARITTVEGNRAYIAAGKEVGLRIGQTLTVYREGKFIEGLGFAPGDKAGTLTVSGFVGPDGAFCTINEGQNIQTTDVVSIRSIPF